MTHLRIPPICLAALLVSLTPMPLMGRSFLQPQKYAVNKASQSVSIADVNGDGNPDLVIADLIGVGIMLGNGDGTFQAETILNAGGLSPYAVAVGDLNGDGKIDVVVADGDSNLVSVLLGNGDGTFQPAQTYGSGGVLPLWIAVADVNRDGKSDVIVNTSTCADSCTNSEMAVLLGNGDGTLQAAKAFNSGVAQSFVVADVNGDGNLDLVAVENNAIGVMLGKGDGTFGAIVDYSAGTHNVTSIAVADVNGDHKTDVLVTFGCSPSAKCNAGEAAVFMGNGDGTFQPFVAYNTGAQNASSIATADVNHDGKVDLVVTNICALNAKSCTGSGIVSVLLGKGDGTFKPAQTLGSGGAWPVSVAVADVNGDKKPDIVVLNEFDRFYNSRSGIVGVMLNTIP